MATSEHDTVTGALALPGAGPQMRIVLVGSIVASRTNPRKLFKAEPLQELADSIKASGVHQPILLRPLPAARFEETSSANKSSVYSWPFATTRKREPIEYELVAGERRWRASQMAGVSEIPAMIRALTDEQALEIQVVENLQREDVSPLEEAEGYEVLMRTGNINADQVGAKIGKSRSYVYGRLKVLDLCEGGRTALREGKIDFSKALLAARIPHEKLQLEAVKWMSSPRGWQNDPPSYRECARHVQQEYMLELKGAQFSIKDASLLPHAGACTDCPRRTGADRDLFADVQSADVCTDTKCYHAKAEAHTARLAAEAREKGQTVIAGKEAEELFGGSSYKPKIVGYRRLDAVEDSPTNEPLRKIIGKQMKAEGIAPTKIENPRKRGDLVDALPNDVALRLLKTVEGQAKAAQKVTKEAKAFADQKKAEGEAKARAKYEQEWRNALLDTTWQTLNKDVAHAVFTLDVHRYLALRAVKSLSSDDARAVADVLGLDRVGAHTALIEYAKECVSPDWLQLLCIMQTDSSAHDHSYGGRIANEGLMLVAGKVFGDGLPDVIQRVQLDMADKYLPKPAAPEVTSPQPPAAQATPTHAKDKAKKTSAAQAGDAAPKTSKEHASAQIAEALAALDEKDQAPAAQGGEAQPVAVAQAAAAPAGEDGSVASNGAATNPVIVDVGLRVRVNESATGKNQKPWIGYEGKVTGKAGPTAWIVDIERSKRSAPKAVVFDVTELEVAHD